VHDRPPEIEIRQQSCVARQVRLRERQVRGGKRFAGDGLVTTTE
jgi:hypothetical protein